MDNRRASSARQWASKRRSRHLVVFARAPRIGRVKLRLARDIGRVHAWHFYRHALLSVLRRLKDGRWNCWLAIDVAPGESIKDVAVGGWTPIHQGAGDLGHRMARVLRVLPPGPVVVVGSDIPGLRVRHISAAFEALHQCEAVFGPALDGGYWLIGMRNSHRRADLFADVRWSTRHALSDTLANLSSASVMFLELLDDVDEAASYHRWRRSGRRAF